MGVAKVNGLRWSCKLDYNQTAGSVTTDSFSAKSTSTGASVSSAVTSVSLSSVSKTTASSTSSVTATNIGNSASSHFSSYLNFVPIALFGALI